MKKAKNKVKPMVSKLMGLIGATAGVFFVEKLRPIIARHRYAWYGWTIPLRKETVSFLRTQGSFNLYGYSSSGCYPDPREATHRVEAKFIVDAKRMLSHWDTGVDANPCPEREKGIQGDDNFYLLEYENSSNFPSRKSTKLPRRTWFPVKNARRIRTPLPLSENVFTPWERYKIHPSALRLNFIEIVDDISF